MNKKNLLRKFLAFVLVLAMVIPAVYLGESDNEVRAAETVVAEDVLKVVAQATQSTVADEDSKYNGQYVLRFTSAIDSLDYDSVGFEVTYDDNGTTKKLRTTTTTVFQRIASSTAGAKMTYSPKVVDTSSEYFFTAKLGVADATEEYTVRAFWVKSAGAEREYGPSRCMSVNDGNENTTSVNVSFKLDENVDGTSVEGTTIYVDDASTTDTMEAIAATVIDASEDGYVHTRVTGAEGDDVKASLKSVTQFVFLSKVPESVGEDYMSLGNTIYRNLGTAYSGADTADTSWYDVYDALGETEFVIATSADLYGFASLGSNNIFSGDTIYVVSDIKANEGAPVVANAGTTGCWSTENPYTWDSIGQNTDGKRFKGTFDGQGHTISGLYCVENQVVGMFASTDFGSVVKNFKLVDSYIASSNGWVGSIAGKMVGTIESVYSEAVVYSAASTNAGGLVGEVYYSGLGDNQLEIKNSWFAGDVTTSLGAARAGGIAGAMYASGSTADYALSPKIENCLVTGNITSGSRVGGIVGWSQKANFSIENCLVVPGTLSGGTEVGSIIGQRDFEGTITVTECYTTKPEQVCGKNDSAGKVVNSNSKDISADTTQLFVDASAITGPAAYKVDAVKSLGIKTSANPNGLWTITESSVPQLVNFAENPIDVAWYYDDADNTVVTVEGTADNAFNIATAEELYGLSWISNNENTTFKGKTINLTADVVLNTGVASSWATNATGVREWTAIGVGKYFEGNFDGHGNTISGVYMNESAALRGFFYGTAPGTMVENFKLTNSYIKNAGSYTGSIVGDMKGSLDSIYSDAIVSGDMQIGGLAGQAGFYPNLGVEDVSITNCWFAGTVSGGKNTGGIVGQMIANGEVPADFSIQDCLVTGTVNSTSSAQTGGVIGQIKIETRSISVERCLMIGQITCSGTPPTVGSLVGNVVSCASTSQMNNSYALTGSCATNKLIGSGTLTADTVAFVDVVSAANLAGLGDTWTIDDAKGTAIPSALVTQ